MRFRSPSRARWLLLAAAMVAASAWALQGEVALREGPHGLEAVRVFDAEYAFTDIVDDGPYVRYVEGGIEARWVCAGEPVTQAIVVERWPATLPSRCGYPHALLIEPPASQPAPSRVDDAKRLVALSDVHGQYALMRQLLQAHAVVDAEGRWALGDGTLVITGDVFDRGPQVTEALWHLYALEQQARAAGGAVHLLLGNHEAMVLRDDLRYLNGKYERTAARLGTDYPTLFGGDSVLGAWLRSRASMLQVGDTLFLHGGIDTSYLELGLTLEEANGHFRRSLGMGKPALAREPILTALHGEDGPLWYRGYFLDEGMTAERVDHLLQALAVRRIVVGHTSMPTVMSLFGGRVIGIDSSIKKGRYGELLLIEDGVPLRGLPDGSRAPLE